MTCLSAWSLGLVLCCQTVAAADVQPMRPVPLERLQGSVPAPTSTVGPVAAAAAAVELEPDADLPRLLSVVRDTKLEAAPRRQAAVRLLEGSWLEAMRGLARELEADPGDPQTQQIIAQAIVEHGREPSAVLQEPMLALLRRIADARVPDVAAALGRFQDQKLERTLTRLAADAELPAGQRQRAVLALGHFRSQIAAETLIDLTAPQQPALVRDTAFASLAQITGIGEFGSDRARWQTWWREHRDLSRTRWLVLITDNLARRNRELARQTELAEARLLESQRQVYRLTSEDNRGALLRALLSDPSPAMRLLGVELADQRFITDARAPTPESMDALMARLDDSSPAVRRRAVRLLRELKNETAADTVAQRLVEGREPDREVVRAYLSMMARLPRAQVCDKAIGLLSDEELRSDAAAVLVAAADGQLLTPGQARQVAGFLRGQIGDDRPVEPSLVALLGRVGDDQDWQRILAWLDSPDTAVKRAAAEAWAASERALMPLAERSSDAVIQPIAINAAARRGNDGRTLLALIQHRPRLEQVAQAWQRALVAMAGRVPASYVLQAEQALMQREEPATLRDQLLTAAIDRIEPRHAAGELLLARADVRLALGDVNQALADLALLENANPGLNAGQMQRWWLLLLRAHLAGGDVDAAFDVASRLFQQARSADAGGWHQQVDGIVAQFLASARRALATNQLALATRIVDRLEQMTSPGAPDAMKQRLAEVRQQIAAAPPPAPPPAPTAPAAPTTPSVPTPPPPATGGAAPAATPAAAPTTQPAAAVVQPPP